MQLALPLTRFPPGFALYEDAVDSADEAALLGLVPTFPLRPFVLRGTPSLRSIAPFADDGGARGARARDAGARDAHTDVPDPPFPPLLARLREVAATRAGLAADAFTRALVNVYPPGAGIGWHRDYADYGPVVLGLSFGAPARLRLRRVADPADVRTIDLLPRSLYVLAGEARAEWEHGVPPVTALRVSLTFRSPIA